VVAAMSAERTVTPEHSVFVLWCRLTGQEAAEFNADERAAFFARPQVAELAATAYPVLLDAGVMAARRGSLPLEHWLAGVRESKPVGSSR
jgi:hypothetical protein